MCFSCARYVYVTCVSGVRGGQRGQSGTEVSDCELLESEPECSLQLPEVIQILENTIKNNLKHKIILAKGNQLGLGCITKENISDVSLLLYFLV